MKKLVTTISIALLAMSCRLAFIGCDKNSEEIGNISVGAVSKKTYVRLESLANLAIIRFILHLICYNLSSSNFNCKFGLLFLIYYYKII